MATTRSLRAAPGSPRAVRCCAASGLLISLLTPQERAAGQQKVPYPAIETVLRVERPRLIIGDEDKPGPALFGGVAGVAMDTLGNVYVLDSAEHSVRAFAANGKYLSSAGRAGRGPGDLGAPRELWHDGASTLYVLDRLDGISVFGTRDGKVTYRTRFGADIKAKTLCGIRGQIFVGANRGNNILHVLSPQNTLSKSFGELFRRDTNAGIQAQYNREGMVMTCDDEGARLFVAEANHEIVRAYEASGRLLWQSVLPEYSGYRVAVHHQQPNATAKFFGEFTTRAITRIGPDLLVVQAARQTRRRTRDGDGRTLRIDDHGIVTYVLSASTGRILTRQQSLAFFLGAATGADVAGFSDVPFPQVYLLRASAVR